MLGSRNIQNAREIIAERALNRREPGLLDVPLPVGSIPILGPILTPLVGDSNQQQTTQKQHTTTPNTPKPTPTPSPTPAPSPTSGSGGSGSGGSDSGGSGSGSNSGGGGSGDSDSGDSGSSGGSTGGDSSSGGSGTGVGQSGSSGDSQGSSPPTSGSNSSGSDAAGGSNPDSTDVPFPAPAGANLGAANPAKDPSSSDGSDSNPERPSKTSAGSKSSSDTSKPIVIGSTTLFSGGVPVATEAITSTLDGTGNTGGGGGGGGGGPSGIDDGSSDPSVHKKISTGAIVGISLTGILLLAVAILFLFRRRAIMKRAERRQWWNNATGGQRYSEAESMDAVAGSGVLSARSSFATTYDHSNNLHSSMTLDFTGVSPPVPPVAEMRDAHGPGLLLHSQPTSPISPVKTVPPPILINFDDAASKPERRVSTFSNRSTSSEGHGQYLMVDPKLASPDGSSPMSVRPFSPSESFSFPKPPLSGDWSSNAPILPDIPSTPLPNFAATPLERVAADPFVDPVDFETIARPFKPTLHDEIAVEVGDQVRVSRIFDDGWALIEKYPIQPDGPEKGKAKMVQGLIPLDCLREANQALPDFLAAKRVSSYGAMGVAQ